MSLFLFFTVNFTSRNLDFTWGQTKQIISKGIGYLLKDLNLTNFGEHYGKIRIHSIYSRSTSKTTSDDCGIWSKIKKNRLSDGERDIC